MPDLSEQGIIENSARMSLDTAFSFRCGPDMPCFNRCCAGRNWALFPSNRYRQYAFPLGAATA